MKKRNQFDGVIYFIQNSYFVCRSITTVTLFKNCLLSGFVTKWYVTNVCNVHFMIL